MTLTHSASAANLSKVASAAELAAKADKTPKLKQSRRRHFEPFEQDAWDNPEDFFREAVELVNGLVNTDLALIVADDRTHKTANPYLHLGCVYRRSGCPFILKLLNRPKEGGWVLRSQYVEGTNRIDPRHGSIYSCIHGPDAVREQPQAMPYTSKKTIMDRGGDPRPPKRPRPSVPTASSALAGGSGQMPRSESAPAISSAVPTTYRMPNYNTPQTVVNSEPWQRKDSVAAAKVGSPALQPLQPRPSAPHANGNAPSLGDRILAPPFARGQALQAHVPAGSSSTPGVKAGMSIGTAYPGHSRDTRSQAAAEAQSIQMAIERSNGRHPIQQQRNPPPVPPQHPQLTSAAVQTAVVPAGYLMPAPAPSHHAAYFSTFRAPTYPLPVVQAKYPTTSPTVLPQWQYFFASLDRSLLPLAEMMARDDVGVTLANFYRQNETIRQGFIDDLRKCGATLWQCRVFTGKVEVEGRAVWKKMKQAALAKQPDQQKAQQLREADAQADKRREKRKHTEVIAEESSEEQDDQNDDGDDGTPSVAAFPNGIAPPPTQKELDHEAGPPVQRSAPEPVATSAPVESDGDNDGDVSMADEDAAPAGAQPEPVKEQVKEPEREKEPEKAKSPSPVIDYGPEPAMPYIFAPQEMTAILTENGADYLSIFKKRFKKGREQDRKLSARELQIFFNGFKWTGFYEDIAAWSITLENSQETEKAWRALNKKQLAGAPIIIDLCARAGKLGSLQSPPSSKKKGAVIDGGEPMLPRRSLGGSGDPHTPQLRERPPPKEVKTRKKRPSQVSATDADAASKGTKSSANGDDEDILDLHESDNELSVVHEETPRAALKAASAATSDSDAASVATALAPRPRSVSPAKSAQNAPQSSQVNAHPSSPKTARPFSLPKQAPPPAAAAKERETSTGAAADPNKKTSTAALVESDSDSDDFQVVESNVSAIPGLGTLSASAPRPATATQAVAPSSTANSTPIRPPPPAQKKSETPVASQSEAFSASRANSVDSKRGIVTAATNGKQPSKEGTPKNDTPIGASAKPSSSTPSTATPTGYQGGMSRKEALFAQKGGLFNNTQRK